MSMQECEPEYEYYGERLCKPPPCTAQRHRWTIDLGTQDTGNAALIFSRECVHCHARRYKRESYLAIADPHTPTGDGQDWVRYEPAHRIDYDY